MDHIRVTTSVAPQPTHPGSGVSLSLRNANPALKAPILEDFASVYKSLGASYYAPLNFSGPDHNFPPKALGTYRLAKHGHILLHLSAADGIPRVVFFRLSMCLCLPRPMTLTDSDGEPLHIVYYAPSNPAFVAPFGERPPCVVNVHGGPTLVALQNLDWMKQWYTSRGWERLTSTTAGPLSTDLNTHHLDGQWGVLDVLDCVRAAHVLSSPPYSLVDPARCVIRGLSAGGYTVLSYAAGSYRDAPSPVQTDTALVVGPTSLRWRTSIAGARRLFHADSIAMPLLMLQGLADRVVPPEQSQAMVDAIVSHGGSDRVKYKTYEGEGHGFSRADTNKSALEEEATWFAQWLLRHQDPDSKALGLRNPYLTNHYYQLPSGHHMGVN
ncbi:Alpha/Beta hydrolase protein [Boletus edulis]|nr:Alpha/Beta hydrolase protein [Boletus edulis]